VGPVSTLALITLFMEEDTFEKKVNPVNASMEATLTL
jgi:hypothetical protein